MRRPVSRKPRTREERKTALLQLLVLRRTIDGLDAEALATTHGLPIGEVIAMVEGERLRRGLVA